MSFIPEYPGDNENRAWVRNEAKKKRIEVDRIELMKRLPARSVKILFDATIAREFPGA